jgi:hypothetical protein
MHRGVIEMKASKVFFAIAIAALVPVIPYAFKGYAGHDFVYHVTSWLAVKDAWRSGQLVPTWSAGANFMLGDSRLSFYPPVSLILGGVVGQLVPDLWMPGLFVWLCFVISGLAMYFASKPFVEERDRLQAALLYMFGPYLITTSLVRFAAAELLVQAWLPLIVLWLYQAIWEQRRRAVVLLGCILGLSWLTDIPASIMLLYGLLPVTAICAWEQRSFRPVMRFILAQALAGTLAAFYLLPVWIEKKWINAGEITSDDPRRTLLFMRQIGSAQPKIILGCWVFALAGMGMVALYVWKRKNRLNEDRPTRTWFYLASVSFFFQLPIAAIFWRYLPQMSAVQFPFRFLPLIGVAIPLLLFAKGADRTLRWPSYALAVLLALFPFFAYALAQSTPSQKTPPLVLLESQWKTDGFKGKPEYMQPGADVPQAPLHVVPWKAIPLGANSRCDFALVDKRSASETITSDTVGDCQVRLAISFYPYWRATDESNTSLSTGKDAHGLLLVSVPPGKHIVKIIFHPASKARNAGAVISLIGVLFALVALASTFNESTSHQHP